MRFDKYTTRFQESLASAEKLASSEGHATLEPEHLLYVLIDSDERLIQSILARSGVKTDALKAGLRSAIDNFPVVKDSQQLSISQSMARLMSATEKLSKDLTDQYVSTELFLLAAIKE